MTKHTARKAFAHLRRHAYKGGDHFAALVAFLEANPRFVAALDRHAMHEAYWMAIGHKRKRGGEVPAKIHRKYLASRAAQWVV